MRSSKSQALALIALAASVLLAASVPADAQRRKKKISAPRVTSVVEPVAAVPPARPISCPEGRTPTGACANPVLVRAARLTSCVATQARLSFSAGPPCATVMQERDYRYPNAVFADVKRDLDVAFGRRNTATPIVNYYFERTGPGTPNPYRYPLY